MDIQRISVVLTAVAATFLLTGCPGGLGSKDYSRDQARQAMQVQMGVVESVREVKIEGTKSVVGPGAGAVVGGVLGSRIGHGHTASTVGAVLGGVAGGVGGAAAEEAVTRQTGVEITVRLDGGKYIAITQAADEEFRPGDRVRILTGGGATRVTH